VARLLMERGADADAADLRGNLALHGAAAGGHLDTLRLLLPRTRQPALKNLGGKSAQDLARERGHEEAARLF